MKGEHHLLRDLDLVELATTTKASYLKTAHSSTIRRIALPDGHIGVERSLKTGLVHLVSEDDIKHEGGG
jgi:hypothetical protein